MHQYLDSNGPGSTGTCVSNTIGKERVTAAAATKWLKDNDKFGILVEFAGGVNDQCKNCYYRCDGLSCCTPMFGRVLAC